MKDLREIKNRYEFQLENRQLVLIFAGMVLILILAFILGILFGRGFSSSDESQAASVMEVPVKAVPAAVEVAKKSEIKEESLKTGKDDKDREELMKRLDAEKVPTALPEESEDKDAEKAVEPKPETVKAEPPESPKPTEATEKKDDGTALPASSTGPYTIQLASFREKPEAEALVAKLKKDKYPAYIIEADLGPKGMWYRVRVGHYPDMSLAEKALKIIQSREKTFKDAFITH